MEIIILGYKKKCSGELYITKLGMDVSEEENLYRVECGGVYTCKGYCVFPQVTFNSIYESTLFNLRGINKEDYERTYLLADVDITEEYYKEICLSGSLYSNMLTEKVKILGEINYLYEELYRLCKSSDIICSKVRVSFRDICSSVLYKEDHKSNKNLECFIELYRDYLISKGGEYVDITISRHNMYLLKELVKIPKELGTDITYGRYGSIYKGIPLDIYDSLTLEEFIYLLKKGNISFNTEDFLLTKHINTETIIKYSTISNLINDEEYLYILEDKGVNLDKIYREAIYENILKEYSYEIDEHGYHGISDGRYEYTIDDFLIEGNNYNPEKVDCVDDLDLWYEEDYYEGYEYDTLKENKYYEDIREIVFNGLMSKGWNKVLGKESSDLFEKYLPYISEDNKYINSGTELGKELRIMRKGFR